MFVTAAGTGTPARHCPPPWRQTAGGSPPQRSAPSDVDKPPATRLPRTSCRPVPGLTCSQHCPCSGAFARGRCPLQASGTAGPSNPAAASPGSAAGGAGSRGGSPAGKAKPGLEASPSQQQRLAAAGGSGCLRDESMMGVRAVAPALSGEQLAEAVRRSTRGPGDLQPLQQPPGPPAVAPGGERRGPDGEDGEAFEHDLPDAIKLGLGDFIFYSMLVGRAAMYDYMTVFSSYLAIIAGLGLTLLCLAIYQKALPALPFSIALGVAFYFLTRLTLEPFLVPLSVHMTYY
ncbi:hypothetical protein PLESTM_000098800 [Pleodorina starrii]|nr:hypothetical protein PLESTM_000098800 [Pleodorina starrii]